MHGSRRARLLAAYDESINRFSALEGVAYFTSHSLTVVTPERYLPVNLLTFYFYTRSGELARRSEFVKESANPGMSSEIDYMEDKIGFLLEHVPNGSILLVDGPLIAGDAYVRFIRSINILHEHDILPIFFVKNSDSNLIVESQTQLSGRFNSDLHWANELLEPGERTSFFRYTDVSHPRNAKVFCYLRSLSASPVRVEVHVETFDLWSDLIYDLMNLVHYLVVVQGDPRNPQPRPVAVAEQYARATLKLIDFGKVMRTSGVSPTMNQERFAW